MSLYESRFSTDWDELDRDEATRRAYAIGVAEKLGESNRRELKAIYETAGTNYDKSLIELAYKEGRQEAGAAETADRDDEAVWADLMSGEKTDLVAPDSITEGRDSLPEAIGLTELLDRMDADSTDVVDKPDFLDR